jgi:hypothetical protein
MKYIILYPIYIFLKFQHSIWNSENIYNSFEEYLDDFENDDDDHDCFTI